MLQDSVGYLGQLHFLIDVCSRSGLIGVSRHDARAMGEA
jgi:hypothetical protein